MSSPIVGPPWFRDLCASFLRYLVRKGRRPNTAKTYTYAFGDLGAWLDGEGIADAEHLTGSALERWQDTFATTHKASSQHVYAAAARSALKWAAMQEPPLAPPTLWLRLVIPRTPHLLPKPIPQRDLGQLLLALAPFPTIEAPTKQYLERLRTRALFFTILSSGMRIFEVLSLDRDQLQDRTATVIQKGGVEKLIVVSKAAEVAIADYLDARADSCDALFVHHDRVRERDTRLSPSGARTGWNNLCTELGIRRFTSHQIRHSCATELLRQHVDSLVIAKHLGQRGLGAIAGYAEVGLAERHEFLEVLDDKIRRAS